MQTNNLNDLIAFVESVKHRSYTNAAKQLGLSRSAVSKRISRLEERLGVRLLHRNTHNISLTDDGSLFFERCVNALEELDSAEQILAQRTATPKGKLRISVPTGWGLLVMPKLTQDFLRQFSQVEIQMSLSDRYVDLVDEGFDLAIRVGIPNADSGLLARTICTQSLITCASPEYLAQQGTPQNIAQLSDHQCLHYIHNGKISSWHFNSGSFAGTGRYYADNVQQLVPFAANGFGIVQLFHYLVKDELDKGNLIPILTDEQKPATVIQAVYPSRRQLSPKVRSFIDFLVARM